MCGNRVIQITLFGAGVFVRVGTGKGFCKRSHNDTFLAQRYIDPYVNTTPLQQLERTRNIKRG